MAIKFYTTKSEYGCFSNFSRHQIIIEGKVYKTSEHWYQAQKFASTDPEYANKIRSASSPKEAAQLGREKRKPGMRKDWDKVKDDIMRKVVFKKFDTHPSARKVLLDTGDEELIEDSPSDMYWGCGASGDGKNMLGIILQEVRTQLRKKYSAPE